MKLTALLFMCAPLLAHSLTFEKPNDKGRREAKVEEVVQEEEDAGNFGDLFGHRLASKSDSKADTLDVKGDKSSRDKKGGDKGKGKPIEKPIEDFGFEEDGGYAGLFDHKLKRSD